MHFSVAYLFIFTFQAYDFTCVALMAIWGNTLLLILTFNPPHISFSYFSLLYLHASIKFIFSFSFFDTFLKFVFLLRFSEEFFNSFLHTHLFCKHSSHLISSCIQYLGHHFLI